MKKIKKTVKEVPKKTVAGIMLVAMVFTCVASLTKVIADTGDVYINMNVDNELGFSITSVTVNDAAWHNSQEVFTTDDEFHIVINVSGNETTGDKIPSVQYGGNWNDSIKYSAQHNGNDHTFVLDLTITDGCTDSAHPCFLGLSIIEDENGMEPGGPNFDGKAYVLWSCGTGTCYHYFDNIPNFDNGRSTFYKDTTIKADNDESISFDVNAQYKAWALPAKFNRWQEAYKEQNNLTNIDWTKVNPVDIIAEYPPQMGEWEALAVAEYENDHEKGCHRPANDAPGEEWDTFESCVDEYYIAAGNLPFIRLQPLGEPNEKNAYVSYGDRNFKVVIYNSSFKGITMGDLSDLHYYPSSWTNPWIMRDQFEVSGTTEGKPALVDSILLESTVIIRALEYNSFAIKSIEALDVPDGAVEIVKDNNGEFRLIFSSNFYDNVTFKITDNSDEISYFNVKRATIDGWIKHVDDKAVLTADFYFDKNKSYTDFDLTAKIVHKDGTFRNVKLTPERGIDDGLGNITDEYEVSEEDFGGKGLKKAKFEVDLEDGEEENIRDIYLNAEYKGSTATNYAGAYVGSGEGVLANIYHGEDE